MNLNFGDFKEDNRQSKQNCFETRRISHLPVRNYREPLIKIEVLMKKFTDIFLFISILIINIVCAENGISSNNYLNQCSTKINDKNKEIRIYTLDNRSIKAEFIGFISDSLSYFDILNYHENKIPLIEVRHIVNKDNKSVFDGEYYIQNFRKEYIQKNEKFIEDISKDMEYNRRTVSALEKIARAQTYFMLFSVITTIISIILIVT